MSSVQETPPDAITLHVGGQRHVSLSIKIGSLHRSVRGDVGVNDPSQTLQNQRLGKSMAVVEEVSTQPCVATNPSLASIPTTILSAPKRLIIEITHAGSAQALVPTITLARPISRALEITSSSRIPPPSWTCNPSTSKIFLTASRFWEFPENAPSRSTTEDGSSRHHATFGQVRRDSHNKRSPDRPCLGKVGHIGQPADQSRIYSHPITIYLRDPQSAIQKIWIFRIVGWRRMELYLHMAKRTKAKISTKKWTVPPFPRNCWTPGHHPV